MAPGLSWSDKGVEKRMQTGWRGALSEGSPCGTGVRQKHTASIRAHLPELLRSYGIQSVCDAGAGDLYWARDTFRGFDYKPFDLVPRSQEIQYADVTKQALPYCDAILCRAVLIHLDPPRIRNALDLFRGSAKYLLASQYANAGANAELHDNTTNVMQFDPTKDFNPTDLTAYGLGIPLEEIPDLAPGVTLALWEL